LTLEKVKVQAKLFALSLAAWRASQPRRMVGRFFAVVQVSWGMAMDKLTATSQRLQHQLQFLNLLGGGDELAG